MISYPNGGRMTEGDKLEFLDRWLADVSQAMREISTAILCLQDRLTPRTQPQRQDDRGVRRFIDDPD